MRENSQSTQYLNEEAKLSFRKVAITDIPLLKGWYQDSESSKQLYATPEDDTEFAYYMSRPHRFVVETSEGPVATFTLEPHGVSAVIGLLVNPTLRGKRLASKTLEFAEQAASELGFRVLSADIYSDNKAAIAAFNSSDFREFIWYEKNIGAD